MDWIASDKVKKKLHQSSLVHDCPSAILLDNRGASL